MTNKVKVIADYQNHVLLIKSSKDSIKITDFWGVPPQIRMLSRKFLEIKYAVRGGSNLGLGNILIICTKNNRLFEAMHVLQRADWETGIEKKNYYIKSDLLARDKNNYLLAVTVHDDSKSKRNPETNYTYYNKVDLSFDTIYNVFYSFKDDLYNQHIVQKTGKLSNQKITGNFPMLILGKETFYFINSKWYALGKDNKMSEI